MKTNKQKIELLNAVITTIKSTTGYELGQFDVVNLSKSEFEVHCNTGEDKVFYATDIVALVETSPLNSYLQLVNDKLILKVYTILNYKD
jgi:ethanolamine utilization protein EutQ (cupin superfamily)